MPAGNGGKMSHNYKPLEEMDVMDNFMINALASNLKFGEPFCRTLLSVLLQRKIGKVKITAQKSLFPDTPKLRGIRMDIIYFYTKGTIGGCEAIKNMLNYIRNSKQENAVDDATREIHNYVSHLKIDPEVKVGYMKFEEIIRYERRDATLDAKIQDILELLEEYGTVPQELQERLAQEKDLDRIRRLLKLAAKVNSIDEFMEKMGA